VAGATKTFIIHKAQTSDSHCDRGQWQQHVEAESMPPGSNTKQHLDLQLVNGKLCFNGLISGPVVK